MPEILEKAAAFAIRSWNGKFYVTWPTGKEREFGTESDANNAISQRKSQEKSVGIAAKLARFFSASSKEMTAQERVARAMVTATVKGIVSELDKGQKTNSGILSATTTDGAKLANAGAAKLVELFGDLAELFGSPDMNVQGAEHSLHKGCQLLLLGSTGARQSGKMDANEGLEAISAYRLYLQAH